MEGLNKGEIVHAWFAKADSDIRSAGALLALDPPEAEAAAFHCQQAAEKYLKGFLAYNGLEPPRVHNIGVLLDLAVQFLPTLEQLREAARFLTPFAVDVRYPFTDDPLTPQEAVAVFQHAQTVRDVVRAQLSPKQQGTS